MEILIQSEGSYVVVFRNWLTERLQKYNRTVYPGMVTSGPYTNSEIYNILVEQLPWTRPYNERFKGNTPRDQFSCGDPNILNHNYSGIQDLKTHNWNTYGAPVQGIRDIRDLIAEDENLMGISRNSIPNSCLVNLYRNGNDRVDWHSDKELNDPSQTVYTITLTSASDELQHGFCPRRFVLKHKKTGVKKEVTPLSGDLIIMTGNTQRDWKHTIPKVSVNKCSTGRISLTYRVL